MTRQEVAIQLTEPPVTPEEAWSEYQHRTTELRSRLADPEFAQALKGYVESNFVSIEQAAEELGTSRVQMMRWISLWLRGKAKQGIKPRERGLPSFLVEDIAPVPPGFDRDVAAKRWIARKDITAMKKRRTEEGYPTQPAPRRKPKAN